MEDLLNNGWIQGGFAFLFGAGGWIFAWRMFRALMSCLADFEKEVAKREEIIRELMKFMENQTHVIDELIEYRSMEEFIRKEVLPAITDVAVFTALREEDESVGDSD